MGLGLLDRDPGDPLGLPDDLRPLDHPLGLHPGGGHDLVGLAAGPLQVLLPLLEQPAGLAQLLGEALDGLVEQLQHLVAVHDGGVRQRHRPGRLDQLFKVGYPSKAGRIRTYEGYLAKVNHELTPEQIDRLATITPYATGASIQDMVNFALINAIREGHGAITWKDVIKAKQLKELGPPEDVEYVERERHAVAVHEACHAVVAYRLRKHAVIDVATIERRGDVGGFVSSIPPEDQFVQWR